MAGIRFYSKLAITWPARYSARQQPLSTDNDLVLDRTRFRKEPASGFLNTTRCDLASSPAHCIIVLGSVTYSTTTFVN